MAFDNPSNYTPTPNSTRPGVVDHLQGVDAVLAQVERRIDMNGASVAVTNATHNNALVRFLSGTNTLTHAGTAGESIEFSCWNTSGNDATVLGVTVPTGEAASVYINGATNSVEVSQSFSGLTSLTVNAPITNGGTAADPNLSVTTNAANGLVQLNGSNQYPALDGSLITGISGFPVADNVAIFEDDGDNTKKMVFELSGVTAGNTRTITMADSDLDLSHLLDVRREVRLTGGSTSLTLNDHSNALVILDSGSNTLTSSGAGTFQVAVWNNQGTDATVLGATVPNGELAYVIIDGANDNVEVSQTFSGVTSVTGTAPIVSSGGATPAISVLTNVANGVALFDGSGNYPAADGSAITNITPSAPFVDTTSVVQGSVDNTKQIRFEVDGNTTGTTRVITAADEDIDLGHISDVRRVVRLNGGTTSLTLADHSNALIILESGTNTLNSGGADTFHAMIWNRSGNAATALGSTVPDGEMASVVIDAANDSVEVSQSGVTSVTATAPLASSGGLTPDISATVNVANGLVQLDANGNLPNAPFIDTNAVVAGSGDQTKLVRIEADGLATATTRTITMPDEDVDLGLVKEINREVEITGSLTLTIADHRNAFLPVTTAGVTVTPPAAGAFYATGANFSGADITVDATTVPTLQMFTILCFGGTSIVKISS